MDDPTTKPSGSNPASPSSTYSETDRSEVNTPAGAAPAVCASLVAAACGSQAGAASVGLLLKSGIRLSSGRIHRVRKTGASLLAARSRAMRGRVWLLGPAERPGTSVKEAHQENADCGRAEGPGGMQADVGKVEQHCRNHKQHPARDQIRNWPVAERTWI